jgi:hypothetical protein
MQEEIENTKFANVDFVFPNEKYAVYFCTIMTQDVLQEKFQLSNNANHFKIHIYILCY